MNDPMSFSQFSLNFPFPYSPKTAGNLFDFVRGYRDRTLISLFPNQIIKNSTFFVEHGLRNLH